MRIHVTQVFSVRPFPIRTVAVRLLFLAALGACYPSANPADMEAAKAGVEAALAQVSPPAGFVTVIRIVPEDFDDSEYRSWGDRACAYARRWVIIVSSRPQDEVVKAYAVQLEAVGFQRKGSQYAHSATLYRGDRDMADIGFLTDGAWFSSHAEYQRLHELYPTVMELYLQTVVPDRRTCGQWSADELRKPYAVPTVTPRP